MLYLLLQSVFIPIILAPLVYLLGKKMPNRVGWVTSAILGYCTLLVLYSGYLKVDYIETYFWQPIGIFGLRTDGLSLPFASIIYILSTALAIYSIPYMRHRIDEEVHSLNDSAKRDAAASKHGLYNALFLIYAAGMLGTVLATNLIQFYIFFELMLIPSYFLIAEFGYGDRAKISLMYFLWTHVGALLVLAGILATGFLSASYGNTPLSFDMISVTTDGAIVNNISSGSVPIEIIRVVTVVMTIGLFVKLAAFGLHIWLPYAHAEAPTPISALLSPAMIGIGAYAFIRIILYILPSGYEYVVLGVSVWGLITMIYGGMMALVQDDVKRLLAYSSVSQMGYIIFGIAAAYYIGVSGSIFQYVSHGTGKAILFMSAGAIIMQTGGIRSISQMGGLSKKMPLTAIAALIGFLAIIGVPPLNGFHSEWMIFFGSFAGALQEGNTIKLIITGIALAGTPLTAGYALWTMRRIFFGQLPDHLKNVKEPPMTIIVPLLFLAFITLLLGIYPALLTERIFPVMESVLGS
tara:strand:+ start:1894 stop:3456 length:1563 start_codon:yes stop_codon:yes gene_type:complete